MQSVELNERLKVKDEYKRFKMRTEMKIKRREEGNRKMRIRVFHGVESTTIFRTRMRIRIYRSSKYFDDQVQLPDTEMESGNRKRDELSTEEKLSEIVM